MARTDSQNNDFKSIRSSVNSFFMSKSHGTSYPGFLSGTGLWLGFQVTAMIWPPRRCSHELHTFQNTCTSSPSDGDEILCTSVYTCKYKHVCEVINNNHVWGQRRRIFQSKSKNVQTRWELLLKIGTTRFKIRRKINYGKQQTNIKRRQYWWLVVQILLNL